MDQADQAGNKSLEENFDSEEQYSFRKIVLIWFLGTAPMVLLAYVVTPAVIRIFQIPSSTPAFLVFWPFMILGLIWQFVLSLMIVKRECGDIRWATIRKRMWYQKPRNPRSRKRSWWLLLWTIPFIGLSYAAQHVSLPDVAGTIFPFLKDVPHYNLGPLMSPEYKGMWLLLGLTLLTIPFNYFLGEEFLFRGILLPKMRGVFGRFDWFFNGVFFAFYHLHKPLGVFHQIVFAGLILSLPARLFRSNWMAVIVHGTEAFVATWIILKVILGTI